MADRKSDRRVARAVRRLAEEQAADCLALWEFPNQDFPAWRRLVGETRSPTCHDYEHYQRLLAAVEAEAIRTGRRVLRARFGVARMRDELTARGLPNTPPNRAAITGELALAQNRGESADDGK